MIQGSPESVKSVLMPDGWLFFPSPSGTREVSAFSPIYNKVEESGRILSLADGIWPDLSHDGWNETESVRTGLWPVSPRHKTGDRRNPARQCINFIVMYVETKSVCLQKYEFSYDIDEKHILKNAMGCRSLPKCPVSLLHFLYFTAYKIFHTIRGYAVSWRQQEGTERRPSGFIRLWHRNDAERLNDQTGINSQHKWIYKPYASVFAQQLHDLKCRVLKINSPTPFLSLIMVEKGYNPA